MINNYKVSTVGALFLGLYFTCISSTDFALHVPVDHGTCENWTAMPEADVGNCTKNGRVIHCFGGMTNLNSMNPTKVKKIEELILCGWPNKSFDPQIVLKPFPRIRFLRIEHSNLTYIHNEFPELLYLESINISWTNLVHIRSTLFKKLHSLKELDLRWNYLDHMEGPLTLPETFEHLYLDGNPWNCTRNLKWLLNPHKGEHVIDRDALLCADVKYRSKHLLTVMYYKMILRTACHTNPELKNCTCTMHHISKSGNERLTPIYAVNCSHLNLNRFPSYIPMNTTIFYGNNNRITDLRPLRNNMYYRNVIDVHLDYNQVPNIDVLEAGFWLRHFRVFSLRGNKLTKLPIYALDNALEDNHNAAKLYLSQNPWICDCKFAMRFRELLMKYNEIIKDSSNITCKYIEGDDNSLAKILELERSDVCKLPTDSKIQPIDLLNGVLASLIVFVIGKLGYDYYHYRQSGRLPWIVTKLP